LKVALYIGGLLGLALLISLVMRADLAGILGAIALAGWSIFWVVPYRALFFLLYALGWGLLLWPADPHRRLSLPYLGWVATVRDGIDRLLPVASVGGAIAGIRLLRWQGIGSSVAAASVIVEVLLGLVAVWALTVIGLLLLEVRDGHAIGSGAVALLVLIGLGLPASLGLTLRFGSVFARLEAGIGRLIGLRTFAGSAAALDAQVRATLRRAGSVTLCALAQLLALLSGSFEVWLALRLFGHPVDWRAATIMECLMQAARHAAFVVPGGLGVQELSLIYIGQSLGVSAELALGVSLIKRMRELVWGVPALISWQWEEGRRLRNAAGHKASDDLMKS
jgi:putative membrane protein